MRRLIFGGTLVALLVTALGCGDINIYQGFSGIDPYILTEYNVNLSTDLSNFSPICGATVTHQGIVTASHCVDGTTGSRLFVTPNDGQAYEVRLAYIDNFETTDVAVLFPLPDNSLPPQPKAEVAGCEPKLGADIWVVGCPKGVCDTLSKGIVSMIDTQGWTGMPMNMFDVTSWYGNSGGGIFDSNGRLVGVVSQFGPQFGRGGWGEPETGWMYGVMVKDIRKALRNAE